MIWAVIFIVVTTVAYWHCSDLTIHIVNDINIVESYITYWHCRIADDNSNNTIPFPLNAVVLFKTITKNYRYIS